MKILFLFTILSFLPSAFAQTYVSKMSEASLTFNGTLFSKGLNRKPAVTFRESVSGQTLTIALEVKHFEFPDSYQYEEFNETFLESRYFPQIRISGILKEKVDLNKDGIYLVTFPAKVTIRSVSQNMNFKVRIEIIQKEMKIFFEDILILSDFNIPYASEGSEIGRRAVFTLNSHLQSIQSYSR